MIVNTGIMFRTVKGRSLPGFLLFSDALEADVARLAGLRLELLLDRSPKGEVFLSASLPDRRELLARSQPLGREVLDLLDAALKAAPSDYRIGLCDEATKEEPLEVVHGGDDPLDPSGQVAVGYRLLSGERWAEAAEALQAALAARPWARGARTLLGRALAAQGKDAEAEKAYLEELRAVPEAYLALNNLGTLYKRRGWMEHAFDCYARALTAYPNHYEGLINFATVLFYFGDLGGVRQMLARAHRVNPEGGLVKASISALADKLQTSPAELLQSVQAVAAGVVLTTPLVLRDAGAVKDLKGQEAYRVFVEEAFRDGKIETFEREILSAAARLLKVSVELQCRIVVEVQREYWQGGHDGPEAPLDKLALYRRLRALAERDGVVKRAEGELLERVAALLALTPEQVAGR